MKDFLFVPTAGTTWRSRTQFARRAAARWGSPWTSWRLLVITSGKDCELGGAVDSRQYQLGANLHVAECNWLVKVIPT